MAQREDAKRRGRPPLDRNDPSVTVSLALSARQYDEICRRASLARVSVPEQIRREMRLAAARRARARGEG
jgi:hypothetical protein